MVCRLVAVLPSVMVAVYEIYQYETGLSKLASQLGFDMASNILKEFWPDLERKLSRKHKSTGNGSL